MACEPSSSNRFGIVLAAGDGIRLKPLIKQLRGDTLPKQYVNFIGKRSMLEHTFHRTEKLIPPDRLFTVVSEQHLRYPEVGQQLSGRYEGTVILQPENKDTAPGLLLPLMHAYNKNPEGIVAIFPSDHFIFEEDLFMAHVESAFRIVEQNQSSGVLLGLAPDGSETEYGYILPVPDVDTLNPSKVRKVAIFVEKPSLNAVNELISKGGLWNTMVMVFQAKKLLDLVKNIAPTLYRAFENIRKGIGSSIERKVVWETYQELNPLNFSKGILQIISQQIPSNLFVLPVKGVQWSDWGDGTRIQDTLKKFERLFKDDKPITGLQEKLTVA
jgi:mannose-1-phosphate guanylyltransferase